jgi:hypothetical protein
MRWAFAVALFAIILSVLVYHMSTGAAVLVSRQQCGPEAAPAVAAAAGLTCETFYDDFVSLSTIDLANDRVPGFKWYVSNRGWSWHTTAYDFLPSSWYSLVAGGLKIEPLADDGANIDALNSCVSMGSNKGPQRQHGDNSVGFKLRGSFYLKSKMSFPTAGTSTFGWPVIWVWPLAQEAGQTVNYVEWDHHEYYRPGNVNDKGVHYWSCHPDPTCDDAGNVIQNGLPSGTVVGSLFNGTSMTSYINDASPVVVAAPAGKPDTWTLFNTQDQCIMLGAGLGTPATFEYIKVWQAPN